MNFSDSDRALFTPDDIRRLMRIEYERAIRYELPLCLMLIGIDRLGYLHDLYGIHSKDEILANLVRLLNGVTRGSDVLGCLQDDRLMVVFPHTTREGAIAVSERLMEGARRMEFQSDGRSLRVTISIGLAITERGEEADFDAFLLRGERGLARALENGGDRWTEGEIPVEPVLPAPMESGGDPNASAPPSSIAPPTAEAENGGPALPDPAAIPDAPLAEQIRFLFSLAAAETGDLRHLESRVVEIVEGGLATSVDPKAARSEQVEVLERRIEKLKAMLGETEADLVRLAKEKGVEPGIRSIYRTVQGLDPNESDQERKRDMLGLIYEANLNLLRKLKGGS